MKVWVIDIETMKTAKGNGEIEESKGREIEANKMEATRLMWIPGESPVRDPIIIPKSMANNSSNSIKCKSVSILKSFS